MMKTIKFLTSCILLIFSFQTISMAQADRSADYLKKYVNETVKKVHNADSAEEKRTILNSSLEKLINAIERTESINRFSEDELSALSDFKNSITEKQNELNGLDGFDEIQDEDLDDFSNFVQQDMEQANRVITISLSTALLIVLILLLL